MTVSEPSTLEFRSNIYPVTAEQILGDELFLHSLRDPQAVIEYTRRAYRYYPTPLQKEIKSQGVGIKCAYSAEGDLCWGTVLVDGEPKVVCRCENYFCPKFCECRPGVEIPVAVELAAKLAEVAPGAEGVSSADERLENRPQLPLEAKENAYEKEALDAYEYLSAEEPELAFESEEHEAPELAEADFSLSEEEPCEPAPLESFAGGQTDSAPIAMDGNPARLEGVEGRYDEAQAAVVLANPSEKIYVNAGPGSGKTHTLIEKIKHMIENQGVDPDRITVLSFTRAAVAVVQNRLKAAAERGEIHSMWQDVDVTTFDKLCTRLLYFEADGDKAAEKKISRLGYDQRIAEARELIDRKPELLEDCCHLVVDETQDLVGVRADFVSTMLSNLPEGCGFTLLGDRCQSIYDYQVKDGGTTSDQFLSCAIERFAPRQVLLERNYRQKSSFPLDLSELRAAILSGDADAAGGLIARCGVILTMPAEPLRKLSEKDIARACNGGTLALLTRTNDQALSAESALWKLGVPSIQGRSDAGEALTRCIADAFTACEGQTVTREEFEDLSSEHDPFRDGRVWKALIKLDGLRLNGDRMRVEDALSALSAAVLTPEISAEREKPCPMTVSTVHAAKGREFDNVWVLAEDLAQFANAKESEEKKVAYVGLSRAASNVTVQCLDEHFLSGGKSTYRTKKNKYLDRYYRKRKGARARMGKTKLVNIEIRNEKDVDFESFRRYGKAQKALRGGALEGEPLRLILRGGGEEPYYEIVLQSDESFAFGRMTLIFCDEYRMCADYYNLETVVLPDAFDEIYIDRVITCVGRATSDATYDKTFGDMAVWYGITIGGYAHRDDSQGY